MAETTDVCAECGHPIGRHFQSVDGKVRCLHVDEWTSDRGVIGVPCKRLCDCVDYVSERKTLATARPAPEL